MDVRMVWLLIPDYGYEGLGEPFSAFDTKEEAEAAARIVAALPGGGTSMRVLGAPFRFTPSPALSGGRE